MEEWKIAVQAEMIQQLEKDKKWAVIVEAPKYEENEVSDASGKLKKTKLCIPVKISDGRLADYYPNQTSARLIATKLQTDLAIESMKKWVGYTIYWDDSIKMNIGGNVKNILYVTDVKLIA